MTPLPFLSSHEGRSTDELIDLEGRYRTDSLVLAFEAALDAKQAHSLPERIILAVASLEREVNNGGFNQFFFNSSRKYAYFVAEAFRLIGCPATASLCDQAVAAVSGQAVLGSKQLQQRAVDASEDLNARLHDLDTSFYKCPEPIEERLFAYIKANRSSIETSAA
jgi:Domain of unknown function (DUF4375)